MFRCVALSISLAVLLNGAVLAERKGDSVRVPIFEKDVRPILKAHCFQCHGEGEELEGGLDLRLRRLMLKGGDTGPAFAAGDHAKSLLFEKIAEGEMPPGKRVTKLAKRDIDLIARWIDAGAKTARPEPEQVGTGLLITEDDRQFWAFQPIRRPEVPTPQKSDRVRNAIDAFVLSRLEPNGLSFTDDADKATLLRRVCFDLLGLPPTPKQLEEFLADASNDAYEKLIDRLLQSPHYGERWGRHWLDVAGYADSEGFSNDDTIRPFAYKYRDYVIRSFNADKPFDQFIQEQLAGDELVGISYTELPPEQIEKLVATGFLRMGPDGTASAGVEKGVASNQAIADTIEIVSTSLLGLTVGCARCHHHRYDPIPQTDYYQLRAIFEPAFDWKKWRTPKQRQISLYSDADKQKAKQIEAEAVVLDKQRLAKQQEFIDATFDKQLSKLPEELHEPIRKTPDKKRTAEQKKLLKEHPTVNVTAGSLYLYDRKAADVLKKMAADAAKLRATKPVQEFVRALTEIPGQVPAMHLFIRGDHEQPKQELQPAGLTILSGVTASSEIPANDASVPTTGRRLAFAKRLTDGTHPLTARVLVNRIWLHHFGRGIVATPGDFGMLGQRPTHPELLDWLASEFMTGGWSVKRLHKLIMRSTTYRQTLRQEPAGQQTDPDNRLFGQMVPRRLEAEVLRDSILAISGKLNIKRFGPPVPVMADRVGQFVIGKENLNAGRPGAVIAMKGEEFRRSVYVQVRRSRPLGVLDTFDAPAMDPNCDIRASSTVAPQSLMLMNSDFIVSQSRHFAERLRTEAGTDPRVQIALAWKLAFAADPVDEEIDEAAAYLTEQTNYFRKRSEPTKPSPAKGKISAEKADSQLQTAAQLQALASFCQTLLSSNRFLYVD